MCTKSFDFSGTDIINVNADDKDFAYVIAFITDKAKEAGLSEKRIADLRLSAEEIFGNIIDYAYDDEIGTVIIESKTDRSKGTLAIRFTDHGKPFDPVSKEAPCMPDSADDLQLGGLGIFLTKELTDDISYTYDNANILTLIMNTKEEIC